MGDWLTPSRKFPSGIEQVIADIRAQGKSPLSGLPLYRGSGFCGLSSAPRLVCENAAGQPLKAEEITYGGWRCTHWYVLD